MSQIPLASQHMPEVEEMPPAPSPAAEKDDYDSDCYEVPPPSEPLKHKVKRAAALERDPLFGMTWAANERTTATTTMTTMLRGCVWCV